MDLGVDLLGRLLRIWFGEIILLRIVITEIGQFIAHTEISHHTIAALRDGLKIVECTGGDVACNQLFGGATSERSANFIEHLFARCDGALFRQIPGSTKRLPTGHNRNLDQRIRIAQKPRYGGVTRFVDGDRFLLGLGHHFVFLLQSAYDSVDGIQEVLPRNCDVIMARCYQRGLITNIGNVGTGEARRLACQKFNI